MKTIINKQNTSKITNAYIKQYKTQKKDKNTTETAT